MTNGGKDYRRRSVVAGLFVSSSGLYWPACRDRDSHWEVEPRLEHRIVRVVHCLSSLWSNHTWLGQSGDKHTTCDATAHALQNTHDNRLSLRSGIDSIVYHLRLIFVSFSPEVDPRILRPKAWFGLFTSRKYLAMVLEFERERKKCCEGQKSAIWRHWTKQAGGS